MSWMMIAGICLTALPVIAVMYATYVMYGIDGLIAAALSLCGIVGLILIGMALADNGAIQ